MTSVLLYLLHRIAQSSQKKITGICGNDENMGALKPEDDINDSTEITTIPENVDAPVEEFISEESTAQEGNELATEEEITEEEIVHADNMPQDSPKEVNENKTAQWNAFPHYAGRNRQL